MEMPVLVGRQRELGLLVELLEAGRAGQGGLAILSGEPGIGKSRLATATASEAEALGFRIAWGRAWESGGAPAFFPWTEALSALDLHLPDASLATALEGEAALFQVFRKVAHDLRRASAEKPILLVLDDLHVADMSSLRLLHFVAREIASMKVIIVATRRDVDPDLTQEMESTLARIAREGKTFVLARLERDDVARLVREEGPRVPATLEAEIWRASQGNPLFVGELVRLLDADPTLGEVPIPYGAREIFRQRLASLDAEARDVLEHAAVAGVEVAEPLLVAVTEKVDVGVRSAIESASRAGILVASAERRVRFVHALFRDALYRDLSPTRRKAVHARFADALEEMTPAPSIEIAHHAIEAGAGERLVSRVVRAATVLSSSFADEDAIRLLERALENRDARQSLELLLLLGEIRIRVGDLVGGRASCARAAEIARSNTDARLLARCALAYAGEVTQGQTDEATHRLLVEALETLGDEDLGLAVRLRARVAASLQPAPDPDAAARAGLDAIAVARTLDDETALLDVLHNAGGAFGEAYFSREVLDASRDAVRLAERIGDRAKLLRARLRLVLALMEVGDFAGADAHIDALEQEGIATAQARHMWPATILRAMRALHEGRLADDTALTTAASEIGRADPRLPGTLFTHRFARLRVEENAPELLALEPQILATVARWNDAESYAHLMSASIRAFAGDLDTARKHLGRVARGSVPTRVRIARAFLADAVVRVGERSRAAELYEQLLPEEGRWHVMGFGGFVIAATYARYLGGLAALLDRHADAEQHFERALTAAEQAGARPECAQILIARGRSWEASDAARAREFFARGRAIAEEVGLVSVVAKVPTLDPASVTHVPPRRAEENARRSGTPRLVQEGETWQLTLGESSVRLKDSRGVAYLARLLSEPERELHVLDLSGAADATDVGDAGEALDDDARAAYKRRLADLDEELREADSWNDGARATRARTEIELLSAELSRAVGLGGRQRRVGSAAERARVAVTRRVRDTIHRVTEKAPDIGRYLEATIHTGLYCAYKPLSA
jgi:tetratricopeptide (TPR) repeat protein